MLRISLNLQISGKGEKKLMKEIPVTGFMVHSPDSNNDHSHILYLTTWDGRPLHKHNFSGVTHLMLGMNIDMLVRQSQHPQEFHIPTNTLLLLH